ncbi:nucleoside transporter [Arthrobacter sp. 2762]
MTSKETSQSHVGAGTPGWQPPQSAKLNRGLQVRLSALWFLQQFAIGAWIVTAGTYMVTKFAASGTEVSVVYLSLSIGAIVASILVGYLADRVFTPRATYIVLHVGAAAAMFFANSTASLPLFIGICVTYMILYMPTQPLATSIVFSLLDNPEKQYPVIRVWGTVGWIAGGLLIGGLGWEQQHMLDWTFILAGAASLLIAAGSFVLLPKTPRQAVSAEKQSIGAALGLDALKLLKNRSFLVFFIASVLVSIPASFFNGFTNLWLNDVGVQGAAGVQTLAQASEVVFFLLMPFILGRFRIKTVMIVAMIGWVIRFVLFSYADTGSSYWMIVLGLVIHGVCFDFFFVTGQIYTDRHAPSSLRASAQGLIFTGTYGVGFLIGAALAGPIIDIFRVSGGHNWTLIWLIPCAIAAVTAIYFGITFRESKQAADDSALTTTTK